jgi:hypothetical protein
MTQGKRVNVYTFDLLYLKQQASQAPVTHTYNPCYLEGKDQEAHGSKPS